MNGARLRSNNIMLDGQDSNDPSVTGRQQPINNTDIVQEVRLITNQFSAEYGRAAGLGDERHHQERHQPVPRVGVLVPQRQQPQRADESRQERRLRTKAPSFNENQIGFTLGGPVCKDRTFFFGSYQNWQQKFLGSGFTLNGAPTEAGRTVLQSAVGSRPQIAALLKYLPAAQGADRQERDVHRQRPDLRRARWAR